MHFHRDLLAICDLLAAIDARAAARRRLQRQPPLALHVRARRPAALPAAHRRGDAAAGEGVPDALLDAIARHGATVLFTAPTSYRAMAPQAGSRRSACASASSAGEALPAATREPWKDATGIEHHRRHRRDRDAAHLHLARRRRCAARRDGQPVPGYVAVRHGRRGRAAAAGHGRAARRARARPAAATSTTPRQSSYVRDGWNYTGDAYSHGRGRLLRLSGAHRRHDHLRRLQHRGRRGRGALLLHPAVAECARASASPDEERGHDREGVRRAEGRAFRRRRADRALQALREGDDRAVQVPAARSSSSTRCRGPRPASCSASACARSRSSVPAGAVHGATRETAAISL